jgi:hypothetical protein
MASHLSLICLITSAQALRWANIVLTVVSEKQEERSKIMFKVLAQREKELLTGNDFQGLNVGSLEGGTKVSIRDIIKEHGEL